MVRAQLVVAFLGALLLPACPADDTGEVDAGLDEDAGADADADVGDPSLLFRFTSEPEVPGAITEEEYALTLSEVQIALEEVRSFGDAAPGDERTTQAKVGLRFSGEPDANQVYFPNAPPSRYSHLAAFLISYSFAGTVVLDQDPVPFTIQDTPAAPLEVSVPLEGVEVTDALVEVTIDVDLEPVVADVDWETFDPASTSVEIDGSSSMIGEIRHRLSEAFEHEHDSRSHDD